MLPNVMALCLCVHAHHEYLCLFFEIMQDKIARLLCSTVAQLRLILFIYWSSPLLFLFHKLLIILNSVASSISKSMSTVEPSDAGLASFLFFGAQCSTLLE
jgi:hypothetical protein